MTLLEIGFLSLTLFVLAFLVLIGFKAIKFSGVNIGRNKVMLVGGLILWQCYIFIASSFEGIQSYEFPPRFALAFIIPSFIFTGIFLFFNRKKNWIAGIPESWLIYFQSFRILVETLFIYAFLERVFNREVTIEGYNFDMLFGISAPIVGLLVYKLKVLPKKVLVAWNYLGLAVLASVIVVFMLSIYNPTTFGSEVPLLPLKAITYPYVLIAGFLMPSAVFMHVLSLVQLSRK